MAALCGGFARDFLPAQEYFDYGLWVPADKYRPLSDSSSVESSDVSTDAGKGPAMRPMPVAPEVIPDKTKQELEEKFKQAGNGASALSPDQACTLARRLGYAPSNADIEALGGKKMSMAEVEAWLPKVMHTEDTPDLLCQICEYYDVGHTGTLRKVVLCNILKNFGEPLSDAEIEKILQYVHTHHTFKTQSHAHSNTHEHRPTRLIAEGLQ